ncbi:small-conductance mechanosensitive channel [Halogeometricum borinquense DSM 11551]|uniref:Small-conductance mechanosensitive channel n=2 Tax=Halogeometricum borinquense TaxID=60847 RepID=E4NKX1_HALBP|nr:mechanosensitive ion channel domain-containing protein [Halogeometricum borinquense]ADQ67123.1 small-conductance mechanosensitive channel [Halogeometricum borinquense DSM 11551]ELY29671.1 small-conductance mechanosensitive channel [Halogeometricum borinquense DSM 11551]RYJ13913.1 mechanosensitive ion channel [Halogeometricum borinquense]
MIPAGSMLLMQSGDRTPTSGPATSPADSFLAELYTLFPRDVWFALIVLVAGVAVALILGTLTRRVLTGLGVPEAIEGTAFERTARNFDTSTVEILGWLVRYFVVGIAILAALSIANVNYADRFWSQVVEFLPMLFFAVVILIVGIVVGDKVELLVAERLRGVKLPQIGIIPAAAKFTVFYLASLIALSQLGVATMALVIFLAAYLFAIVFLGGIAFADMLKSGAAGTYLLLTQPYAIGDEIRVGDTGGIVQEVDLFVTHVEDDGEEYIVPNRKVFEEGIVRLR